MAGGLSEDTLRALSYPEGAAFVQAQELSAERRAVYAKALAVAGGGNLPLEYSAALPGFAQGSVAAVLCDDGGQKVQHLVHAPPGGSPTVVSLSCKVLMDDISPTQMVEYRFATGDWMLSGMSVDGCEMYRANKWEVWLKMWKHPDCKAALVRMIQAGLVNRFYDPNLLPTPEDELPQWKVVDEKTGKVSLIAHPVAEMRMWDADKGEYREFSALLDGAPSDADVPRVWNEMLGELKAGYIEIDGEVLSGSDLVDKACSGS